jgi:hypothetical protein
MRYFYIQSGYAVMCTVGTTNSAVRKAPHENTAASVPACFSSANLYKL